MFPIRIRCVNWIVCTIRKQVKVRKIIICIDESTPGGVVVSALEIVQPGFSVIDITAVAERIVDTEGVLGGADGVGILPLADSMARSIAMLPACTIIAVSSGAYGGQTLCG